MNLNDLLPRAAEAEILLKALANRHRLMLMCELHDGERSVNALVESIGLSQSALSQHLARLRADKLVATRREAQVIYYRLADPAVARVIALLHEIYCGAGQKKAVAKKPSAASGASRRERKT